VFGGSLDVWLDSEGGVGNVVHHTALVSVEAHLNVSVGAPVGSPRVSQDADLVAALDLLVREADEQHTVVEVLTAAGSDNSTGVELEGSLVGLDGDGQGLVDGGEFNLVDGGSNGLPSGDVGDNLALVILAAALVSSVRIVGSGHKSIVSDVLEGVLHEATTAAHVVGVAVNHLLLRKLHELTSGDGMEALNGLNSREGPAGSALTLVVDGGDISFVLPVDLLGDVTGEVLGSLALSGVVGELVVLLSLLMGEVSHEVDADLVGVVGSVELLDELEVLLEGSESELELLLGSVALAMLGNEPHELKVSSLKGLVSGSGSEERGDGERFHLIY